FAFKYRMGHWSHSAKRRPQFGPLGKFLRGGPSGLISLLTDQWFLGQIDRYDNPGRSKQPLKRVPSLAGIWLFYVSLWGSIAAPSSSKGLPPLRSFKLLSCAGVPLSIHFSSAPAGTRTARPLRKVGSSP